MRKGDLFIGKDHRFKIKKEVFLGNNESGYYVVREGDEQEYFLRYFESVSEEKKTSLEEKIGLSKLFEHQKVLQINHWEETQGNIFYTSSYVETNSVDQAFLKKLTCKEVTKHILNLAYLMKDIHEQEVVMRELEFSDLIFKDNTEVSISNVVKLEHMRRSDYTIADNIKYLGQIYEQLLDCPKILDVSTFSQINSFSSFGKIPLVIFAYIQTLIYRNKVFNSMEDVITDLKYLVDNDLRNNNLLKIGEYFFSGKTRYHIKKELGFGGYGDVYLVQDYNEKAQALKYVKVSNRKESDAVKREVKLLKKINNKYVPKCYEYFRLHNECIYTMEYVEGETLKSKISDKIPIEKKINYVSQIADVMQAVHDVGVIHKDLSPDNIILNKEIFAHIIDFGIAHDSESKSSGKYEGKMPYSSPQRLMGKCATFQDDIFALGVICYELLNGRTPWKSSPENTLSLSKEILNTDVEGEKYFSEEIPPAIAFINSKMLARLRGERYQCMSDIKIDLQLAMRQKRAKKWFEFKGVCGMALLSIGMFTGGYFYKVDLDKNFLKNDLRIIEEEKKECELYLENNKGILRNYEYEKKEEIFKISAEFDEFLLKVKKKELKPYLWYNKFKSINDRLNKISTEKKIEELKEFKIHIHKNVLCSIYESVKVHTNTVEKVSEYYKMFDAYEDIFNETLPFRSKDLISVLVGMHYGRVEFSSDSIVVKYDKFYERRMNTRDKHTKKSLALLLNEKKKLKKKVLDSNQENVFIYDVKEDSKIFLLEKNVETLSRTNLIALNNNMNYKKIENYELILIDYATNFLDETLENYGINRNKIEATLNYLGALNLIVRAKDNSKINKSDDFKCWKYSLELILKSTRRESLIDNSILQTELARSIHSSIWKEKFIPAIHNSEMGAYKRYKIIQTEGGNNNFDESVFRVISTYEDILKKNELRYEIFNTIQHFLCLCSMEKEEATNDIKPLFNMKFPGKLDSIYNISLAKLNRVTSEYSLQYEGYSISDVVKSDLEQFNDNSIKISGNENELNSVESQIIKRNNVHRYLKIHTSLFKKILNDTIPTGPKEEEIFYTNLVEILENKIIEKQFYTRIEKVEKIFSDYSMFKEEIFSDIPKEDYLIYSLNRFLVLYQYFKYDKNKDLTIDIFKNLINIELISTNLISEQYRDEVIFFNNYYKNIQKVKDESNIIKEMNKIANMLIAYSEGIELDKNNEIIYHRFASYNSRSSNAPLIDDTNLKNSYLLKYEKMGKEEDERIVFELANLIRVYHYQKKGLDFDKVFKKIGKIEDKEYKEYFNTKFTQLEVDRNK